jgi:predicted nucleotidyltransferase
MSITPEQAQAIGRWGATTQYVGEVRLFGSQATGEAKEGSDIDLAIKIESNDPGNTVLGIYFARGEGWQDELGTLLAAKVHVGLYNDPNSDVVRQSCDKCSVTLFP